jgi:DNA-binding transcriptional LysR family regulator
MNVIRYSYIMLDLGGLHVFYWVSRLGGVGAAARELHVTQPAVSQRLKLLERQCGRKLYGRAGNKLVLTEHGRRLYEGCRPAIEALLALEDSVKGGEAAVAGEVRICALSEFAKAFLLPRIEKFQRRHPGASFHVEYRHAYEMMSHLSRHEVDLAFTNELYTRPQFECAPAFEERIVCAGPPPARRLSWKDLGTLPWFSCGSEDNVWSEFERRARAHGVELPRPSIQIAEMESILTLAARRPGFTLAPAHALELRKTPRLAVHELPGGSFSRTVYACRLKSVPLGSAAQAFWTFILPRKPEASR